MFNKIYSTITNELSTVSHEDDPAVGLKHAVDQIKHVKSYIVVLMVLNRIYGEERADKKLKMNNCKRKEELKTFCSLTHINWR